MSTPSINSPHIFFYIWWVICFICLSNCEWKKIGITKKKTKIRIQKYHSPYHPSSPKSSCQLTKAVHGSMFWYCFSHPALPWLAGSYPLDWMDDLESDIFGFLMKNWVDSAKKIRGSPKFVVRGQMVRGAIQENVKFRFQCQYW